MPSASAAIPQFPGTNHALSTLFSPPSPPRPSTSPRIRPIAAHYDPLRRQLRLRSRLGTATGRPDRDQVVLRPRLVQLRAVGSVPVRWELLGESGQARVLEGKGGALLIGAVSSFECRAGKSWAIRRAND